MTFYQTPRDDDRGRRGPRPNRTVRSLDLEKAALVGMLRNCAVVVFVAGFALVLVRSFSDWTPWAASIVLVVLGVVGIVRMARIAGNDRSDALIEMVRYGVVAMFAAGCCLVLLRAFGGDVWVPWPAAGVLLGLGVIGAAVTMKMLMHESSEIAEAEVTGSGRQEQSMARPDIGNKSADDVSGQTYFGPPYSTREKAALLISLVGGCLLIVALRVRRCTIEFGSEGVLGGCEYNMALFVWAGVLLAIGGVGFLLARVGSNRG